MILKKTKIIILTLILTMIIALAGCTNNSATNTKFSGQKITVYKSEFCGCCGGYVAELEKNGFDVEVIKTEDLATIKEKYNVPKDMQSCHTAVIGDYFIEGHVPLQAVEKLLDEKPEIDGIALPNMPAGAPGMPGSKKGTWMINSVTDGKSKEFMKI